MERSPLGASFRYQQGQNYHDGCEEIELEGSILLNIYIPKRLNAEPIWHRNFIKNKKDNHSPPFLVLVNVTCDEHGCHKVWEGGVLVLPVDSWTAGELAAS
jgi:hypothetical protein